MSVSYHETMCHAEKLVHYLQFQGHSEGLYNQYMTVYFLLLYLLNCWFFFVTELGLIVQYYKPECPVEKLDYCVQGQGHSEG